MDDGHIDDPFSFVYQIFFVLLHTELNDFMKHKLLIIILLTLAFVYRANAQFYHDFTAVTPTGQTLYYTIHGNNVTIVNPYSTEGGAGYVSGDMIIPDSVQHISDNDTITYAVTALYYSAFRYCDSLTSVVLPNGITSIPYCAFGDCTGLKSVSMGDSVTSINSWAFSGCFAMQSLYVPESVTNISSSAFNAIRHIEYYGNATGAPWSAISMNGYKDGDCAYANPTKKTLIAYIGEGGDVVIPESVDSIGYGAFYFCRSLNSVTIPDSVMGIGSSAFSGCSNLIEVNFLGEMAPRIGEDCFSLNATNRIFNIPCGSYSSYSDTWSDPNLISSLHEPDVDISFTVLSSDPSRGLALIIQQNSRDIACDSSVIIRAVADYGYQFDHWSNGSTNNPDTLYLTGDSIVVAYFVEEGTQGINVTNSDDGISAYSLDNRIVINGLKGNNVAVYSVDGRIIATKNNAYEQISIPIQYTGIYFVSIDGKQTHKVVVK